MYQGKKIAVVVPAYNEEVLIERVLSTMPQFVDQIYVVDDCSRDATAQRVERFARTSATNGRVTLIRHETNQGVGRSIVTGYKRAIEDSLQIVAVMAGDAQMDPCDLERVIEPVATGKADYVKGNRLFTGEAWEMIPRHRYLGNAFLSLLTKIASGYWHLADSQTGYTAVAADTLQVLPLDQLYPRYGYPNHMLVMLNIYGQRVRDVPVRPVYGIGERSGIRLRKVIPKLSWLLYKCFWWRLKEKYVIRDFHPLIFFYLLAFALLPAGVIFGLVLLWHRLFTGPVEATSALFATFLVVSGLQSLFFAMWFDMDYNRSLR